MSLQTLLHIPGMSLVMAVCSPSSVPPRALRQEQQKHQKLKVHRRLADMSLLLHVLGRSAPTSAGHGSALARRPRGSRRWGLDLGTQTIMLSRSSLVVQSGP